MKKNRILFSKRSQSFLWILLFSISTVFAQVAVTGVVTDELKEPMPGVSVIVKGTKTGTVTDTNGRYRISMPKGSSVLTFSFLGYAVKEVTVGNKKQINVEMKEDAKMLDEVVAIGYGSVKKSDLTGSVSKGKDSNSQSLQMAERALHRPGSRGTHRRRTGSCHRRTTGSHLQYRHPG